MEQVRAKNPVVFALYLNAALLLLIVLMLARRAGAPDLAPASAFAQQAPSRAGGSSGIYVMPAQFYSDQYGCYVLNADDQILCTYLFDNGVRQLKLVSARDLKYDIQLKNFATSPAPWDVQQMIQQEQQDKHGNQQ